jgi:hypothetical protein
MPPPYSEWVQIIKDGEDNPDLLTYEAKAKDTKKSQLILNRRLTTNKFDDNLKTISLKNTQNAPMRSHSMN